MGRRRGGGGVLVDGVWREGVRDFRARFLRLGGEEKLGTQKEVVKQRLRTSVPNTARENRRGWHLRSAGSWPRCRVGRCRPICPCCGGGCAGRARG